MEGAGNNIKLESTIYTPGLPLTKKLLQVGERIFILILSYKFNILSRKLYAFKKNLKSIAYFGNVPLISKLIERFPQIEGRVFLGKKHVKILAKQNTHLEKLFKMLTTKQSISLPIPLFFHYTSLFASFLEIFLVDQNPSPTLPPCGGTRDFIHP